jgi:hypothetical protein
MLVRLDTASTSYCLLNGQSCKIMQISVPIAINQLNQFFHRFAQVFVSIFRKRPCIDQVGPGDVKRAHYVFWLPFLNHRAWPVAGTLAGLCQFR